MNKRRAFFFAILLPVCMIWAGAYYLLSVSVIPEPAGRIYELKPNTSAKTVRLELAQTLHLPHVWILAFYGLGHSSYKSGEYLFKQGSSLKKIWHQITTGTGLVYHPFTIVPGWTFQQLKQQLLQEKGLKPLMAQQNDQAIMAGLGQPGRFPEGLFFPETYYFTKGIADKIILKRALDLMSSQLQRAWQQRSFGLPYKSAYEALIAASLIEREAYLDAERPVIAGVIMNRLQKNMLLQIDASVIYGLGKNYQGKIYKKDLQDSTPYNTYVYKGLPPTPIAMPGRASLDAAMHPKQHDYYYYVARPDGSHVFSKTLAEHQKAVAAILKKDVKTQPNVSGK